MIYLDNAATSYPKPSSVLRAMKHTMRKAGANPGRAGHQMALEAGRLIYHTRESLASLFSVDDPFRFIFTSNCTEGLNIAIQGMVKPNGHVITTIYEHNSVLRPLHALKDRLGISVTYLEPEYPGMLPALVERAIQRDTCLVVMTHVSNVTGQLMPIEKIARMCQGYKIPFLVDGAQSAGIVPIDLKALGVDLFAFPGHKGLLGPQGTGSLYIKEGIVLPSLMQGGTGSHSAEAEQPAELPDLLESGTPNTPGIAGLQAGIEHVMAHHQENARHEWELSCMLWECLAQIPDLQILSGPPNESGILLFNFKDVESGWVADQLDTRNIACRAGLHCAPLIHQALGTLEQGAVRLSIGPFSTRGDILDCAEALLRIRRMI